MTDSFGLTHPYVLSCVANSNSQNNKTNLTIVVDDDFSRSVSPRSWARFYRVEEQNTQVTFVTPDLVDRISTLSYDEALPVEVYTYDDSDYDSDSDGEKSDHNDDFDYVSQQTEDDDFSPEEQEAFRELAALDALDQRNRDFLAEMEANPFVVLENDEETVPSNWEAISVETEDSPKIISLENEEHRYQPGSFSFQSGEEISILEGVGEVAHQVSTAIENAVPTALKSDVDKGLRIFESVVLFVDELLESTTTKQRILSCCSLS